jgi:hypothetical protein
VLFFDEVMDCVCVNELENVGETMAAVRRVVVVCMVRDDLREKRAMLLLTNAMISGL